MNEKLTTDIQKIEDKTYIGEPNVNSSIGLSDDTIIAAYTVNMDCTNSTNHGDWSESWASENYFV